MNSFQFRDAIEPSDIAFLEFEDIGVINGILIVSVLVLSNRDVGVRAKKIKSTFS
jgi:tetrahydromethanopterin S-methyltransferase subunit E